MAWVELTIKFLLQSLTQKYSVNSRDSSSYYFDLDIPEVQFLKTSHFEVGESSASNNWTTNNTKSIADMVFYTCVANYSNFEGKYTYPSCAKCNRRALRNSGNLKCPKCTTPQGITQAIITRISIHDQSGTCVVSLFGNMLPRKIKGYKMQRKVTKRRLQKNRIPGKTKKNFNGYREQ
ncbi:hypothetical protein FRX31_023881 [Thalictrum thalictroides]|uniref:Uncharacterized protein n=1 Tax=Thalictrum thalictroides TaxID=46969 RepID=A0A7J6VQA3_THATH|nr:hypothetical protein FRX31_023881 [Thalictrum thalictroides]